MASNKPLRPIRMDDELYLKIKYISHKENRSYNQQAVYILKEFVTAYEEQHGVIPVDPEALYQ